MVRHLSTAVSLAALLCVAPAQAVTVYSNNFDAPAATGGGAVATLTTSGFIGSSVGAFNATYGNFLRGESNSVATELTLSSLPGHTAVSMGYIFGFMDSWDSRNGGCCSPDNVDVYIDGVLTFSYTYNNALGSIKDVGAGTVLHEYVQFDGNFFYSDTIVDMSTDPGYSFAHSGSTLKIGWIASGAGWQGGGDEGYALDNIRVAVNGVPEPSTYALMALGLAGVGAMVRRRRSAV